MATYSIDAETFDRFDAPRSLYDNSVELITLDNVAGHNFRIVAKRGGPFSISTLVGIDTFDNGWGKIGTYRGWIDDAAKRVVFEGYDFDSDNMRFKVLSVTPGAQRRGPVTAAKIVGSIVTDAEFWVATTIQLIAVEHTP